MIREDSSFHQSAINLMKLKEKRINHPHSVQKQY